MESAQLFSTLHRIEAEVKAGGASSIAAQQLVDLLHVLGHEYGGEPIARAQKSRHMALVLQQLVIVCKPTSRYRLLRSLKPRTATSYLIFSGIDFSGLTLPAMVLSRTFLIGCNFDKTTLVRARFNHCQLEGCSFRHADLTQAHFHHSQLLGCSFEDANLHRARGIAA